MSNIKVYVEWERPVIFSGEEVKCSITVTNETEVLARPVSLNPVVYGRRSVRSGHETPFALDRTKYQANLRPGPHFARFGSEGATSEGHQSRKYAVTANLKADNSSNSRESFAPNPAKHARSVSIVSLGGSPSNVDQQLRDTVGSFHSPVLPQNRRHRRTASVQGPGLYSQDDRNTNSSASPIILNSVFSSSETATDNRILGPTRKRVARDLDRCQTEGPLLDDLQESNRGNSSTVTIRLTEGRRKSTIVPSISRFGQNGQVLKSITPLSPVDTPRTSTDLNSPSNNSTETLISEYIGASVDRPQTKPPLGRQSPHLVQNFGGGRSFVTLIMGYACLTGSFMLEESLVNTSLFEEVKRKSTIGRQGSGGVVGIETTKRGNGLLRNIGWHNLSESLGGLLKPIEPSTLRSIEGLERTSTIPIISTPQTVLFVDLRLKPGEAKTFTYSHFLPIGVPATHKGRAIKISYSLIVGVQKQQVDLQQHPIRHVEVPFRVLPGVDVSGSLMKHDLMCPYIQTNNLGTAADIGDQNRDTIEPVSMASVGPDSYDPFSLVSYVQDLLSRPTQDSSQNLLSPTESASNFGTMTGKPHICPEGIIEGICTRGMAWPKIGPSRYQIQRDGEHVAVMLLTKPVYRIGETIPIVVDFRIAKTPCHSVHFYLESLELVDPAVALRSESITQRATRRIHASRCEYTCYATRISCSLTIPINATPSFMTSSIDLIWQLRIAFFTVIESSHTMTYDRLMEEAVKDDRGRILAAKDELRCDSFEVNIPLRVFGSRGNSNEQTAASTGLVI